MTMGQDPVRVQGPRVAQPGQDHPEPGGRATARRGLAQGLQVGQQACDGR